MQKLNVIHCQDRQVQTVASAVSCAIVDVSSGISLSMELILSTRLVVATNKEEAA